MIKPTGRLGITGATPTKLTHKTFEVEPHSQRQADISADYHGKTIQKLNPTEAMENARRYPQIGLGG